MSPLQFADELHWSGWGAMAARAFNLRPAEVDALVRMMRAPGRTISHDTFATFDGTGTASRGLTGSHAAIAKRIQRVREKLGDAGCRHAVVTDAPGARDISNGYSISIRDAGRVHEALRLAFGVELRSAA
jgi:hypothetical protein